MTAALRFRDVIRRFLPWYLQDRGSTRGLAPGFGSYGYQLVWSMVAPLDAAAEVLVQATQAPYPGLGTPTALPYIGRDRGVTRAQDDTDASYAARLLTWLDDARLRGKAEGIARAIQGYLSSHPMVRIVTRSGRWVTLHQDGTVVLNPTLTGKNPPAWTWDWDSISNPERVGDWSDVWIIVYQTQWPVRTVKYGGGLKYGSDKLGRGHFVTRAEYDAVKGEIAHAKSCGSRIRTVIWSYDATQFDPLNAASLKPDGKWGTWGYGDPRVRTRHTSCRYWEP